MKCQVTGRSVGELGRLGQQLLGAVLAQVHAHPPPRRSRIRSTGTVFVAATTDGAAAWPDARGRRGDRAVDLGPRSAIVHADHRDHRLAAGHAVAPVREVVGRRTCRCPRRRRRRRRTRRARAPPAGEVEGRRAVDGRPATSGAEPPTTREVVGAELVVLGRMHGPSTARTRPVPIARTRRRRRHDAGEQAPPPGVDHADRVVAGERDRRAVGREHHERDTGTAVTAASASARSRGGVGVTTGRRAPARATPTRRAARPGAGRDGRRFSRDGRGVVADVGREVARCRTARPDTPPRADRCTTRVDPTDELISAKSASQRRNSGTSNSSSPVVAVASRRRLEPTAERRRRGPSEDGERGGRLGAARLRSGRSRPRSP